MTTEPKHPHTEFEQASGEEPFRSGEQNSASYFPGFSPSPSPALSAYSYTSSASGSTVSSLENGGSEEDVGYLSLDDWGFPRRTVANANEDTGTPSRRIGSEGTKTSGTATPIGSHLKSPRTAIGKEKQQDSPTTPVKLTEDVANEAEEADMEGVAGKEFDLIDANEDDMHASGIPAARGWKLDATLSQTSGFKQKVLEMFTSELQLKGWKQADIHPSLWPLHPEAIHLRRISGALTNAVFFVSYRPDSISAAGSSSAKSGDRQEVPPTPPPTLLLRVYGVGTEVLLSRRGELLILHTLSSLYEIGPHILGTFANGRVEEYFECEPIGREGIRDLGTREEYITQEGNLHVKGVEGTAHWVARRMRELHEVPLEVMRTVLERGDLHAPSDKGFGRGIQNHIMASSHRPRRGSTRQRALPSQPSGTAEQQQQYPLPGGIAGSGNVEPVPISADGSSSPMAEENHQHGSSLITIASEAASEEHEQWKKQQQKEWARRFSLHRESSAKSVDSVGSYGSIASFDSLATSFDSRASFSSSLDLDRIGKSPRLNPVTPGQSSYFPGGKGAHANRIAQSPKDAFAMYNGAVGGANQNSAAAGSTSSKRPYPGVWRRMKRWSREAAKVLQLFEDFAESPEGKKACAEALKSAPSSVDPSDIRTITSDRLSVTSGNLCNTLLCILAMDFPALMKELDTYKRFIRDWERREGQSKRIFAHNDSQYGNLLVIKQASRDDPSHQPGMGMPRVGVPSGGTGGGPETKVDELRQTSRSHTGSSNSSSAAGVPEPRRAMSQTRAKRSQQPHQQLVVIDFEYASPNPRAYDIANHFHEWRTDYHHPSLSWSLTHHGAYPDRQQRRKWLRAYVQQGRLLRMRGSGPSKIASLEMSTPSPGANPQALPDFSLGPPAIACKKPSLSMNSSGGNSAKSGAAGTTAASMAADAVRRSSSDLPTDANPSLTPFLRGASSPRSPAAIGAQSPLMTMSPAVTPLSRLDASIEREVERLEREVNMWSPASHAVWGLWGIVFGRAEIESVIEKARRIVQEGNLEDLHTPDTTLQNEAEAKAVEAGAEEAFDYMRYALGRIELFRYEIADIHIT